LAYVNARATVLTLFCVVACGRPQPPLVPDQPSIVLPPVLQRVLTDYERAWTRAAPAALAELFVEDGFALSPGGPMVRGRAAIAWHYRDAKGPLALRAVAFATEGNIGYIVGAFSSRADAVENGKFTLTLRKDASGRWLIVSDMDNGNQAR
jgi:uncharacterized protein (TIGR02246 family)